MASLAGKADALWELVRSQELGLVCVQETHLTEDNAFAEALTPPWTAKVELPRTRRAGRAAAC